MSLYLLTMGGHLDSPDEELMFQVTRSLVERGSLTVSNPVSPDVLVQTGIDGQSYAHYGPVSSILSMPFYVAGRAVAAVLLPPRYTDVAERFAVGLRDPLISAAAAVVFYVVALELGYSTSVAIPLTLAFGGATFVWPMAKYSWSEPVTGFWLLLSVYMAMRALRDRPIAWGAVSSVALGLAIGSKITTGIAAPALLIYLFGAASGSLSLRVKRALPFALILALPALGLAIIDTIRFGNPLVTGYFYEGYLWHPIGLAGLLFSPSKSLFLYAPIALLGVPGLVVLARRVPWASGLFLWLVASHIVAYGLFVLWWHGDAAWGPRYLLPVLPFIVLPAGAVLTWGSGRSRGLWWNAFAVLAVVGVEFNLGGVLVDQRVSFYDLLQGADYNPYKMDDRRWDPTVSPILVHWTEFEKRVALVANWWSQPVSLVSGTYAKEPVADVDTEEASQSDLFPRWTDGSAVFDLRNPGSPVQLSLEYLDNRPGSLGPARVQLLIDGEAISESDITRTQSKVALPDGRYPWFIQANLDHALSGKTDAALEIRTQTWMPERDAPPSADIRNLGIQIWDLHFVADGRDLSIKEAPFTSMPVTDNTPWSFNVDTWFYTPPHLVDMWFWYLSLSDLPHVLLLLALIPAAGVAWSMLRLRQLLA